MSSIMRARSGLMGVSLIGVLLVLRCRFGHPHPQTRALHIPLPFALPGLNAASARALPKATARCYEADAGRLILVGLSSVQVVDVRRTQMTEATAPSKVTLHCALELSKSSWLLAI